MGLFSKWIESLAYEYEISTACTRYRSPRSSCTKCITSCHKQAISLKNSKPVLDKNKCVECGLCIAACPEQAVTGIFPKRTTVNNQLVIKDNHVPSVKELLILYKMGVRGMIYDDPSLIEGWKQSIQEANAKLEQLGEEPYQIFFGSIEKKEELYSRRELFSLWSNAGKSVVKQAVPAKWRFNQESFDLPKFYTDFQFAKVTVDVEKCTLCGACQKLCYKHCIEIDGENFTISSQSCSACQLCADICPEQAIMVEEQIFKVEGTKLLVFKKFCNICQENFHTLQENDETCFVCSKSNHSLKNIRNLLKN